MSKRQHSQQEDCPPWSSQGRTWSLHRASGCRVAIGDQSIVLCPLGAKDCPEGYPIRFLHGWAQQARRETIIEYPECSSCQVRLSHRRLTDGIVYAVGIGLFVTPGPAEPEGVDERPQKIVCESCARRLWDRSEAFLDALDSADRR
jgi:hypothetical protein